ncbi:MAG TPA: rhodanese-like domain-containing protein [Erysipelotrichaceae bacterium]|jgi:rhodanese-related sulfurtransferase|nr:rhodanese-like domain-containing protein [Erysipelotrichia bacterium]HPX32947.1 rhodanese-like domain-containing protein [Erysipelotrichaceae bacterium]HQA85505.1 rhodanese-like domain-containing protein [Erysipelotrichaceae bacterium]
MGFFDIFNKKNIDQWLEEYKTTSGAILIDVRNLEEYQQGHIPESKNIPLKQLDEAASVIKDENTPLYVYCRSGVRSGRAASTLKHMGYVNVVNIGGILSYLGKVER